MVMRLLLLLALLQLGQGETVEPKFRYVNDFGIYYVRVPSSGNERLTWYDAQDECRRNGSELFFFETAEERDDVVQAIPNESRFYWIGVHDIFHEGIFLTVADDDMSASDLLMWDPSWNSTAEGNDCVAMHPDNGVVRAIPCDTLTDSICKIPKWKTYSLYPGVGYYSLHEETMSWDDAKRTCGREGASLAVVNSEEESRVLQEILAAATDAFVGVHDQFKEDVFITVKGISLEETGWANFEDGQPDNLQEQDCLVFTKQGFLRDESCFEPRSFICEHEI